jgi:hypothetical protein
MSSVHANEVADAEQPSAFRGVMIRVGASEETVSVLEESAPAQTLNFVPFLTLHPFYNLFWRGHLHIVHIWHLQLVPNYFYHHPGLF